MYTEHAAALRSPRTVSSHAQALFRRGRRKLEADKARSDHHGVLCRGHARAQRDRFIQCAQKEHVLEVGARYGQRTIARAGREHELVVFDH